MFIVHGRNTNQLPKNPNNDENVGVIMWLIRLIIENNLFDEIDNYKNSLRSGKIKIDGQRVTTEILVPEGLHTLEYNGEIYKFANGRIF